MLFSPEFESGLTFFHSTGPIDPGLGLFLSIFLVYCDWEYDLFLFMFKNFPIFFGCHFV